MMIKRLLIILACCLLISCGDDKDMLKVGTISGPETKLMQVAKEIAMKNYKLNIKIVEFSDYAMPNRALHEGELDANVFQHKAYLDAANKQGGYNLVPIARTFIFPMGIYSNQYTNLSQVPNRATVAIPNDPSNTARALNLLAVSGLLTLRNGAGVNATTKDIIANPRRLKFRELDAAQLTRALSDVDIAIINTNYAIPAGLNPRDNAIFMEDKNSAYANVVAVRKDRAKDPRFVQLIEALHSPSVEIEAKSLFNDAVIRAW